MSSKIFLIIFPLCASLLLAGCSLEDVFSKLATTNEEQGANEAYIRSKIIEAKQQKINQMKQQFPDFTDLKNVSESGKGVGVAYRKIDSNGAEINVEVMLPDSGRQIYEVWLKDSMSNKKIRLGALSFNQTDDYSLSYSSSEDLSQYSSISISLESVPDDVQETIIMTGTFGSDQQ